MCVGRLCEGCENLEFDTNLPMMGPIFLTLWALNASPITRGSGTVMKMSTLNLFPHILAAPEGPVNNK